MNWKNSSIPARRIFLGVAVIAVLIAALMIYAESASIGQHEEATLETKTKSDDGSILARGMLSLVVVFGLIIVIAIAMRRMNGRAGRGKAAEQMHVISSVFIGSKKQVVLMRVMNRVLVLGVTEAAINKLAEFPSTSQEEDGAKNAIKPDSDFMSMLEGWRR